MLHTITENGDFTWQCHKPERHKDPRRTKTLTAHISHDTVQYVDHDLVALPPCPHCAELGIHCQTFVKVNFTEEELAASNMTQYGMIPTEMTVPHAITGEPVPVMIPALKPVGPNPAIERHQKFAELLTRNGKHWTPKKEHHEHTT